MPPCVCMIGSGPSGLYLADAIVRARSDARVDAIERLPTPYGLIRSGVAPDHPGTKAVARQFDRLLARLAIRFLGGVEVGRDVALAELRALFDAVVLAVGAPLDRRLGVPGEGLAGVHGSGAFVGWYNGHPDFAGLAPEVSGPAVAVIGAGNVALDVARLLAKTPQELAGRGLRPVSFADWKRIEAAEAARVEPDRPREKFRTVAEMRAVPGR